MDHTKKLFDLEDESLVIVLAHLPLMERVSFKGLKNKRMNGLVDQALLRVKVFNPRLVKHDKKGSQTMEKTEFVKPATYHLDSVIDATSDFGMALIPKIKNITFISCAGLLYLRGNQLAKWCPFIKQMICNCLDVPEDYAHQLTKDGLEVHLEYIEATHRKELGDICEGHLPLCTKLHTLVMPQVFEEIFENLPSNLKSFSANLPYPEILDHLIRKYSTSLTGLTVNNYRVPASKLFIDTDKVPKLIKRISENFPNLVRLEVSRGLLMSIHVIRFLLLDRLSGASEFKFLLLLAPSRPIKTEGASLFDIKGELLHSVPRLFSCLSKWTHLFADCGSC